MVKYQRPVMEVIVFEDGLQTDGGTFSLCLPGHNFTTHWNAGSQGHDEELIVPYSGPMPS